MLSQASRFTAPQLPFIADGWSLERLTPPSRLFGANGLRTGADSRIYVAQVSGSQISAIDIDSGAVETVSPMGSAIVGPDDLVFDARGDMYVTEFTEGRVSALTAKGEYRVVLDQTPCANPITMHQGRLLTGECRPGGRIMELDLNGGAPRVIVADVPMPNAMEVGPDGKLYFPVMATNEIWRVDLKGGTPEKVAGDLGVPDSVKFDSRGCIISTQIASGQVLRIDPRKGERTVLASIAPGLDNCTFVGERLFVSSISGQVNEILADGQVRSLVPDGLNWPLGLALGSDGILYVADGGFTYTQRPGQPLQVAGMFFTPGYPGYVRGIAATAAGEVVVTTALGNVARWNPAAQTSEVLASGHDQLYGVAVAAGGTVIFAERGTGRVLSVRGGRVETLASGLRQPGGVAITADGDCLVSETGGGRVVKLSGGRAETLLDDLQQPQGLVVSGSRLYVLAVGTRELIEYDLLRRVRRTVARGLPVGAPEGVIPKFLKAVPPLSGPMGPFAGIAAGGDGTLYLSADADGSVLALRPA
jgi:sugar lactone lactonase YvrE